MSQKSRAFHVGYADKHWIAFLICSFFVETSSAVLEGGSFFDKFYHFAWWCKAVSDFSECSTCYFNVLLEILT
jgi:hypothetical protein